MGAREDAAIVEAVKKQEAVGMRSVTDGEYRRESFHFDFISKIDGIQTNFTIRGAFAQGEKTRKGGEKQVPLTVEVVDRMQRPARGIEVENSRYLQSRVGPNSAPKITIPSPTMTHFRGGRDAISRETCPEMADFFADFSSLYRQEDYRSCRLRLPLRPVR